MFKYKFKYLSYQLDRLVYTEINVKKKVFGRLESSCRKNYEWILSEEKIPLDL